MYRSRIAFAITLSMEGNLLYSIRVYGFEFHPLCAALISRKEAEV